MTPSVQRSAASGAHHLGLGALIALSTGLVAGSWAIANAPQRGAAAPPPRIQSLTLDKPPPRVAGLSQITWTVIATGGAEPLTYEFRSALDEAETVEQTSNSPSWVWTPQKAGTYRVTVLVTDALGRSVTSSPSAPYEILPRFTVRQPAPDKPDPQPARTAPIVWSADVAGGVGKLEYEFWLFDGIVREVVQRGAAATWSWTPSQPGTYRVRVVAQDGQGNRVEGAWSAPYRITGALEIASKFAFLPPVNLTGTVAPIAQIAATLRAQLVAQGIELIDEDALRVVMERHRIRYVGGLSKEDGAALQQDAGVKGVIVSSVDAYEELFPPRVALTCRIVSTTEKTAILWMESAEALGDQSPGFLAQGLITDPQLLVDKVTREIAASAAQHLSAPGSEERKASAAKIAPVRAYPPKSVYRSAGGTLGRTPLLRVAVLPLANQTVRRDAGELIAQQLIRQLIQLPDVEVVEPGVVRAALLQARVIQRGGLSLAQADLIRALLDADLVLMGTVLDYADAGLGVADPVVGFTLQAVDTATRKVVWSSRSRRKASDNIVFFDVGRVRSAQVLAAGLARGAVTEMVSRSRRAKARPSADKPRAAKAGPAR